MKKSAFLFTFLFVTKIFLGQDISISGRIIDVQNQPLPFASVSLYSDADEIINGTISETDGRFLFQGTYSGEYTIRCSFIGYDEVEIPILIGELNDNYDVGRIVMEQEAEILDEVTVEAQRSIISANLDRRTYEIEDNITGAGGSVLDVMKGLPGVTVDQEGKVILRGSDKVSILIDNKQSSLTGFGNQKGLDNIPAANIENIEIINNPSARYDASGMAGIINIIYKKEQQTGFHGSVGLSYGLGALTKPKEDLPTDLGSFSPTPKYIPSLDLNYNNEKFSFSFQSEIFQQKRLPNNEFTTRYYDDGRTIVSQVPENRKQIHVILNGGMDYRFDDYNILSFSGIYDWESHVDSAQVPYINMLTGTRNRYLHWNEEEITGYMNYALHYEHKFKEPGHTLDAHIQYSKGWEDETYYIHDSSDVRINGRDVTSVLGTEHTTSFTLDYIKPLSSGRIETGTKLQIRSLPVDYEQERGENTILYPGLGNWTKWGESIYAGYVNWVHEKTKYEIEAGIRAEYTTVFYDMDKANIYWEQDDKYDYFKLFPNIRLSYKFNENNKISIFYNQRIDRPGEPELRMYAKSDDHELVKVGNPYLRPQYTQSAEIGFKTNWESGSLFASGYYRIIKDSYMRVYTKDTSRTQYDVILKSYANTGKTKNMGLELVFDQSITSFWKLSGNVNFYRNTIEAYTGTLLFPYEHTFDIEERTDNTWDFNVINTFDFSEGFQVQLTGLYMAPKNIPQGKQYGRSSIDLGIKQEILKNKGEIVLTFSDIFNDYGIRQDIEGEDFSALYENYYETQIFTLGFKYKF